MDWLSLVVLCAASAALLVWLVHPWFDVKNDAAIYIASAGSLLSGEGYAYLGAPLHLRPPGFPVLIAPVVAAFGTDFHALNFYVALFGCGSLLLLFCWARPRLGGPLALLACLAVGTNPVFLRLCSQVMSDVPGVFCILAGLLMARHGDRNPSIPRDVLLGVWIGLSAHVRTLALLLLPAILIHRVIRERRRQRQSSSPDHDWGSFSLRRLVPLIAMTIVVIGPWMIQSQRVETAPFVDQLQNYAYTTAQLHTDPGDPRSPRLTAGEWGARIAERAGQISAALATRLQDDETTWLRICSSMAVLALFAYWLVTAPSAAGIFVALCLAVIGSYFAFQDRILLPAFVLLVPALCESIHRLVGERFGNRFATGTVSTGLGLLILLDFTPRASWARIEQAHHERVRTSRALSRSLPDDAGLATAIGFSRGLLMSRPVYSLRWAARHAPGVDGVEAVIGRYGVEYVILDGDEKLDAEIERELVDRYGPTLVIAGVRVLRVRR